MRCGSCVCHALVALLGVLVSPLTASAADIPAPPEPAELVALRDLIEIDAGKPSILCIGVTGRTGPRVLYHLVVVVDGETFAERLRPSNDAPGKVCRVVQPGAHDVAVVAASAVGPPSLLGALGWWVGSSQVDSLLGFPVPPDTLVHVDFELSTTLGGEARVERRSQPTVRKLPAAGLPTAPETQPDAERLNRLNRKAALRAGDPAPVLKAARRSLFVDEDALTALRHIAPLTAPGVPPDLREQAYLTLAATLEALDAAPLAALAYRWVYEYGTDSVWEAAEWLALEGLHLPGFQRVAAAAASDLLALAGWSTALASCVNVEDAGHRPPAYSTVRLELLRRHIRNGAPGRARSLSGAFVDDGGTTCAEALLRLGELEADVGDARLAADMLEEARKRADDELDELRRRCEAHGPPSQAADADWPALMELAQATPSAEEATPELPVLAEPPEETPTIPELAMLPTVRERRRDLLHTIYLESTRRLLELHVSQGWLHHAAALLTEVVADSPWADGLEREGGPPGPTELWSRDWSEAARQVGESPEDWPRPERLAGYGVALLVRYWPLARESEVFAPAAHGRDRLDRVRSGWEAVRREGVWAGRLRSTGILIEDLARDLLPPIEPTIDVSDRRAALVREHGASDLAAQLDRDREARLSRARRGLETLRRANDTARSDAARRLQRNVGDLLVATQNGPALAREVATLERLVEVAGTEAGVVLLRTWLALGPHHAVAPKVHMRLADLLTVHHPWEALAEWDVAANRYLRSDSPWRRQNRALPDARLAEEYAAARTWLLSMVLRRGKRDRATWERDKREWLAGARARAAHPIESGEYVDLVVDGGETVEFAMEVCAGGRLTVTAAFSHDEGDMDLQLLDSTGVVLDKSDGREDGEQVEARVGAIPETILIRVYGFMGAENTCSLTVRQFDCDLPAVELGPSLLANLP